MTTSDPVKQAWQAADAADLPRLEDVRARAGLFHRRVRRRNALEYAAALITVPVFVFGALTLPSVTIRTGCVLAILGILFVVWQLHRRASAVGPGENAAAPLIAHQRAQLVRQRDALASVGTWYLLPLVPGLVVILLAPVIEGGWAGLAARGWFGLAWLGIAAAFFLYVWRLNRAGARRLQAEIDALDALEGDME